MSPLWSKLTSCFEIKKAYQLILKLRLFEIKSDGNALMLKSSGLSVSFKAKERRVYFCSMQDDDK